MNTELLTALIFEQIQEKAFADIDNCIGCQYLLTTKDPYGTGDSPTEYECDVVVNERCPVVKDFIQNIKDNH
jgi:hypothetical protein